MPEVEPTYRKTDANEYLLAADKLANKYELTSLGVLKLASWCAFESGAGIFNNNPGNIRGGANFFYHPGKVDEYINGKYVVAKEKKDPLRKFASYPTLTDGIEQMLLWVEHNHPKALDCLKDDNKSARDFGLVLGEPDKRGLHYYTGDKNVYANGCDARFRQIMKVA